MNIAQSLFSNTSEQQLAQVLLAIYFLASKLLIMWTSKIFWCLGWQTVTQDPHLTHWRRESTLLDSPTSHPSPKNEATCLSTNLIHQVRRCTENSRVFHFQAWAAYTVPLNYVYSSARMRYCMAQRLGVPSPFWSTMVHKALDLSSRIGRPVPLWPFTFFWEEHEHQSLPWNTFCLCSWRQH